MKKSACYAVIIFCLSLPLAGCADRQYVKDEVEYSSAVETLQPSPEASRALMVTTSPIAVVIPAATPNATATPIPKTTVKPTAEPTAKAMSDEYFISGLKITRRSDGEDSLVYTVTTYFPAEWNCHLSNLLVEEGNAYFTESGTPGDQYQDSVHRLICLNRLGRIVLYESDVCGYDQIVAYGNRIFFIIGEFDSSRIGWASKDGSDSGILDFALYAAQYQIEPVYNLSTLYFKDGMLYADIDFYTGAEWPEEIESHTVHINDNLSIERMDG